MFKADKAPDWKDGTVCYGCRSAFSMLNRRHHCRSCGQIFCQKCSGKVRGGVPLAATCCVASVVPDCGTGAGAVVVSALRALHGEAASSLASTLSSTRRPPVVPPAHRRVLPHLLPTPPQTALLANAYAPLHCGTPAAPLTFRPYMSPFRLQTTALPKFGIEKEVRVCDTCHDKNAGPGNKPDAALPLPGAGGAVSEMEKMRQLALDNQDLSPEEEVRRALAAERANPTQRSPQVGRANPPGGAAGGDAAARAQEDEELQLALALSMSEEEARKSQPSARSRYPPAASTYNPPPVAPQSSSMYNFDDNLLDDDPMARYMSIARQLGESREGRRSARSPRSFPVYSLSFAILCLLYRHS